MIIQTSNAGPTVGGTACVSATNGCKGRSEEGHGPYCTQSADTVVAVTEECVLCMCMCTAVYTKQVSICLRRHKIVRYIKTLRQAK